MLLRAAESRLALAEFTIGQRFAQTRWLAWPGHEVCDHGLIARRPLSFGNDQSQLLCVFCSRSP
jgi:hypothetical protein